VALDAISVTNPKFNVVTRLIDSTNKPLDASNGADMTLGLNVLKHLHLYVAYHERGSTSRRSEASHCRRRDEFCDQGGLRRSDGASSLRPAPRRKPKGLRLTLVGSYDMVDTQNGQIGINMQIGSETKLMLVDTGAWFSFLSTESVGEMKLPTRSMSDQFVSYDAYGGRTSTVATAPSIEIGPLQVTAVDSCVASGHRFGKGVAGLLGANVLKHFDIELDFAKKKLNFFDPDHCPGKSSIGPRRIGAPAVQVRRFRHHPAGAARRQGIVGAGR